jgi:hypothetical protein
MRPKQRRTTDEGDLFRARLARQWKPKLKKYLRAQSVRDSAESLPLMNSSAASSYAVANKPVHELCTFEACCVAARRALLKAG